MTRKYSANPPAASKLPSQQPARKDDFERGYDKGVALTTAVILDLIDSRMTVPDLRNKVKRMHDDASK